MSSALPPFRPSLVSDPLSARQDPSLPGILPVSAPILIEDIGPRVSDGRYPIKRVLGEGVVVSAAVFRDGHVPLAAALLWRRSPRPGEPAGGRGAWHEVPLTQIEPGLARWRARFDPPAIGRFDYLIEAWSDDWAGWRHDTLIKRDAGLDLSLEVLEGMALIEATIARIDGTDQAADQGLLSSWLADAQGLETAGGRATLMLSETLDAVMARHPDRSGAVRSGPPLSVVVDPPRAGFAAWYEMAPRSQASEPGRWGTFADCAARLPDIRAMGFDTLYLMPIHPIGRIHRKGPNNSLKAGPDDPGSPYAIGAAEGGHTAIHPELGTLDEFRALVAQAGEMGMDVALDIAIQCAPDHPWVSEHPEWFEFRPDGTIKYAENPPKKYQDIVNLAFWGPHRQELWLALLEVFTFWAEQGVRVFRVDNPHTKPVPFWEWLIATVKARYPDCIFLAEAFTRPPMMKMLAKIGFTQSYSYFTWRTTKAELTSYMEELVEDDPADYMRVNFFANTPDILPFHLQTGGRPAFMQRLVLAATLSSVYGIHNGFELCENAAIPGKEEYADSEKYDFKPRDWNAEGNIKDLIAKVNWIRNENPALQAFRTLRFFRADNDQILFYGKMTGDRANIILVAVNLDPHAGQGGLLWLPLAEMGLSDGQPFIVEELLSGTRLEWTGSPHHYWFDPATNPAAIFRITP
ncbi:alpha-1,4-glucan--maltose-1-phosphate maltosyltransferase [Rhodospirillum rubrum]|uniref:Alpha-1,4-glucan:maltose-1-phosphate maltosyltransferase n=1 Tax=Rhodospirillum rubrum (strain ATCC 11170 / ATH 1.1.1 / DSM 467 / LMG 4362 / NCIMB 8255 / S1) TaxID=269796 RepID=GLGE_RHORT|nr:alpha-1,4-glucan--maltose-1-phosphate maltosyltransferase [Rhodospirillum rubrum]Q2RTZ1.1 RecName: Full=Alpha-1,4-glucan:maltose-1-phosphate maltosyltransferase; Short=GMPMT; AltName: Full=(1->4)-alpha-D-glucan:maltose-1-phosphate alpha-D-maltosyltransferase [Rhodospirillum rubrum ATCC 11170]ABC22404.1 Alpha amylase, catalytic region [Rhodospirillum rubrum ATCC 11170]AEO48121.1 alpha amylase, catalytic region [Rhodospirillum rubrum F11]MBK5953985.1 alpha-1,4-glucan--maltose-1-phosphate malto